MIRTTDSIDMVCPVNWLHPLNSGLQFWWLCVPNITGGATVHDIAFQQNLKTTNFTPNQWSGPLRPGGFGCLTQNGTDQYSYRAVANFRGSDRVGTISAWFKTSVSTGFARNIICSANEAADNNDVRVLILNSGRFGISVDPNNFLTTAAFNDGRWHQGVVVSNGAAWTIYVDGVEQAGSSTAGSNTGGWFSAYPTQRDNVTIGVMQRLTGLVGFWDGQLDDLRIFNRALSAFEVKQLYLESKLGYPNLLRRVQPYYLASSAVATPWLYARRSSQVIGGGVL